MFNQYYFLDWKKHRCQYFTGGKTWPNKRKESAQELSRSLPQKVKLQRSKRPALQQWLLLPWHVVDAAAAARAAEEPEVVEADRLLPSREPYPISATTFRY